MGKHNLSRRDILKLAALGLGGFLAACSRLFKAVPPEVPAATKTPTAGKTKSPLATDTPTATQTSTDTPSPTPIPCFKLLTPENGTKLPALGKVTFSWEAMPGATRYQLQIILPSGQVVPFDVDGTSSTRYLESFLTAGIYQWTVVAFDSSGAVICSADPFTFEKEAAPTDNDGGGNNDPSCFLAGTMIRMADGSSKSIEEVKAGDLIKAFDETTREIIDAKVNRVQSPLSDHYCELTLANGTTLKLTENHPLFTKKAEYEGWGSLNPEATAKEMQWLKVQKIAVGDALFFYDGSDLEWVKVVEIQKIIGTVQTYNLIEVTGFTGGGDISRPKFGGAQQGRDYRRRRDLTKVGIHFWHKMWSRITRAERLKVVVDNIVGNSFLANSVITHNKGGPITVINP